MLKILHAMLKSSRRNGVENVKNGSNEKGKAEKCHEDGEL